MSVPLCNAGATVIAVGYDLAPDGKVESSDQLNPLFSNSYHWNIFFSPMISSDGKIESIKELKVLNDRKHFYVINFSSFQMV